MNEILTLVTFLALLFYTGIEMKFQLQMLQQNSYRNDRYNRWLKGESFATISRLTDLFLLLLLSTNFLPTFVQIVTITVVLAKSVKGYKPNIKNLWFSPNELPAYTSPHCRSRFLSQVSQPA